MVHREMNLDEILDFLFHKALGICITVCTTVVLMLTLTSCVPLDFCACFWAGCGASECADVCADCSVECDDVVFSCYGGSYSSGGYSENSESCALTECLFGRYGCERQCGDAYWDCGGVNLSFCEATCFNGGNAQQGCYDTDDGHSRATCANCIVYCDAYDDPASPIYEPEPICTITVISYDNTKQKVVTIYENSYMIPAESSGNGIQFKGYYSQPNGQGLQITGSDGYFMTTPTTDMTIYEYCIDVLKEGTFTFGIYSFDPVKNQYNLDATKNISVGGSLSALLPTYQYIEGYEFLGWYYSEADKTNHNVGGYYDGYQPIKIGDENGIYPELANFNPRTGFKFEYRDGVDLTIEIIPMYKQQVYQVTVIDTSSKDQDGNYYKEKTYDAIYGSTLEKVSVPNYAGKIFVGYFYDEHGQNPFDVKTPITENNMTLYLIYQSEIVLYYEEEGTSVYSEKYYLGQNVELPEPKKVPAGMKFSGWLFKNDQLGTAFKSITITEYFESASEEERTLVPDFTPATYTITYYFGEEKKGTQTYKMGEPITYRTDFDQEHFSFVGWYKDAALKTSAGTGTSASTYGDFNLYAKYTAAKYKVELNDMGGTVSGGALDYTVTYGAKTKLPTATMTGYTFNGWYYLNGSTKIFLTDATGQMLKTYSQENIVGYVISANSMLTLFADFSKDTYNVTFSLPALDGDIPPNEVQSVDFKQKAQRPDDPYVSGYEFIGWYTSTSYSTEFDFDTLITKDTTVYAKFKANEYTVVLKVTGGYTFSDGSTEKTFTYTFGSEKITSYSAPQIDEVFTGWSTSADNYIETYVTSAGKVHQRFKDLVKVSGTNEIVLYSLIK